MDRYCAAHGYSCYHFSASLEEWQRERVYDDLDPGFFKLQAVRTVLLHHAWVLYLDTDNFVSEVAPSVDRAISGLAWVPQSKPSASDGAQVREASLLVHGHPGETWISSSFLVRNTAWADAYLERAWALREHCPDCQREQCAMNIAIFETVLAVRPAAASAVSLRISAISQAPQPSLICCNPRDYCRFPDGRANQSTPRQSQYRSRVAQSCAAVWLTSTEEPMWPGSQAEGLVVEEQSNVFWSDTFLATLGIKHGVKNAFRRDRQENLSTAVKGQPRHCAPFTPPTVNRTRSERCLELALRLPAEAVDGTGAPADGSSSSEEEWRALGCHTFGRANAARFVGERNGSSMYLAELRAQASLRGVFRIH